MPRTRTTFKKGENGGAKGGKRKGAGRKPTEFIEQAKKIGDPLQVIQFYYDVAIGKEMEQVVTDTGETVRVAASCKDRLNAGEHYLDRTIGKVPQALEHSGPGGESIIIKMINYGNYTSV